MVIFCSYVNVYQRLNLPLPRLEPPKGALFQRQRDLCGRPEFQALPAFGAVGLRQLGADVRLGKVVELQGFFCGKKIGSMDCDIVISW